MSNYVGQPSPDPSSDAAGPQRPAHTPFSVSVPMAVHGAKRILVAEDDELVRMLVRAVLSCRGYEVLEAADGEEGVRLFQERGPFDLVILDHSMPKLGGHQALKRIRALNPSVPALGLSGMPIGPRGPEHDLEPDGFDARLNKPFHNTELLALAQRLLNQVP
jgi:CheY-like chemotaxis protein